MQEYLLEPFLARYFLLEAICGELITESRRRSMYDQLAQVFCISDQARLEELYQLSRQEPFAQISSYSAYERLCRTMEFAQRSGQALDITADDRMLLAQKREAMLAKAEIFRQEKNLTHEGVSAALLNQALNGNIHAMTVLSYMEYHGICLCQDPENALRRMRLCARWNDLAGNLMCIAYDGGKQVYYDTLYTFLRNASQRQVFHHIRTHTHYTGTLQKLPVARILEKAFGLGIVKRGIYDQVFAKVAFCQVISAEDKEKLLLNKQKEAIVSLSDIPFDLSDDIKLTFRDDCLKQLPLARPQEQKKILQNLAVAQNCPAEAYTPLLIVAQEEYLSEMYRKALKEGLEDACVVELDASTLSGQDFAPGRENVLLRGLSETKACRTVFLIEHCEALEGSRLEELMKLLDHDYRKKFKLFQPSVCLDLSGLVFVLLASERGSAVHQLSEVCDCLWAERISPQEKDTMVDSIFRSRAQLFGCQAKLEPGCREHLAGFEARQVQGIIDGALRTALFENSNRITLDDLNRVCQERSASLPRRGFGYVGGNAHA